MCDVDQTELDARLTAVLRDRGQRVTAQRLVLHRALHDAGRHVSAEELARQAAGDLPGVALPTVYATLDLLTEAGLARRVPAGGAVLFDPVLDGHAHVRCTSCGRVEDLPAAPDVGAATAAARAAGFEAAGAEVVVTGRCAACREA
jgi:Fe2+ or Zn2+ uptake regulation protein